MEMVHRPWSGKSKCQVSDPFYTGNIAKEFVFFGKAEWFFSGKREGKKDKTPKPMIQAR